MQLAASKGVQALAPRKPIYMYSEIVGAVNYYEGPIFIVRAQYGHHTKLP